MVPLAPGRIAITFSPLLSTKIIAIPVGPSARRSAVRSTPSAMSSASASSANPSVPTAATSFTSDPARRAASAWFAPLPPAAVEKVVPGTVSPGEGMRDTCPIRSRLAEPKTVITWPPPSRSCSSCAW
jgi:hypothetical protein